MSTFFNFDKDNEMEAREIESPPSQESLDLLEHWTNRLLEINRQIGFTPTTPTLKWYRENSEDQLDNMCIAMGAAIFERYKQIYLLVHNTTIGFLSPIIPKENPPNTSRWDSGVMEHEDFYITRNTPEHQLV